MTRRLLPLPIAIALIAVACAAPPASAPVELRKAASAPDAPDRTSVDAFGPQPHIAPFASAVVGPRPSAAPRRSAAPAPSASAAPTAVPSTARATGFAAVTRDGFADRLWGATRITICEFDGAGQTGSISNGWFGYQMLDTVVTPIEPNRLTAAASSWQSRLATLLTTEATYQIGASTAQFTPAVGVRFAGDGSETLSLLLDPMSGVMERRWGASSERFVVFPARIPFVALLAAAWNDIESWEQQYGLILSALEAAAAEASGYDDGGDMDEPPPDEDDWDNDSWDDESDE